MDVHVGRGDLLDPGHAHGPLHAAGAQRPAEGGTAPVARVREHDAEGRAGRTDAVQLLERDLPLGAGRAAVRGDSGAAAPGGVGGPLGGQEEAQGHRDGHLAAGQRERDERLAVRVLAGRAGVLVGHPDRAVALLGQRRVVHHQHGVAAADQPLGYLDEDVLQRGRVPGRGAHEVVQLLAGPGATRAAKGRTLLRSPLANRPRRYTGAHRRRARWPSVARNGASHLANSGSHRGGRRLVMPGRSLREPRRGARRPGHEKWRSSARG